MNGHGGIKEGQTEQHVHNWIPEAWILSSGLREIANVGAQLKRMIHGLCVTDRVPRAISYWCGGGNATDRMVRECDETRSFLHIFLWTFEPSLYENSLEESSKIRGDGIARCAGPGHGGSLSTGTNPPCTTNPDLHQKLISLLGAAHFFPAGIIVRETKAFRKIRSFPAGRNGQLASAKPFLGYFPVSPEARALLCVSKEAFSRATPGWRTEKQLRSISDGAVLCSFKGVACFYPSN